MLVNQYVSEKVKLEAVKINGLFIHEIKNPSEEIQLAAIKQNGAAIQHIKKPSEKIQLAAIKQNGSLVWIHDPSEFIIMESFKLNPSDAIDSLEIETLSKLSNKHVMEIINYIRVNCVISS